MRKTKRNIIRLSALSAAVLALGLTGKVHADAYTFSWGDVSLSVFNIDQNRLVDVNDFSSIVAQNTSSTRADLLSVGGIDTNSSLISADSPLSCQGGACGGIGENFFGQVAAGHFARSDTGASGALITGLANTPPANVDVLSEIRLSNNDLAQTDAQASNNTGFTFTLPQGINVRFDLSADTFTQSLLTADAIVPPSIVGSNHTWEMTLLQGSTTIFNWSPDGQAGGITGGTEISDGIDLTFGSTVSTPGADTGLLANSGTAQASVFLPAGSYTFRVAQFTSANAAFVPEPGILGLMGLGFLMLGFSRNRKKA
ncbi:MAG: PEP-CTERM sorting domain-containing protein [Burkholderiales bacterium]|uniref:EDSAP-1 family PEP-CTERM protein n=1 Tax=Nitrosomonas sp. TaxID=42353 RepID=UPI001DE138DF|nr:EDSAP-1 family PEP-CTERM protein [Nitrosomonas sp.]MCB1948250.1 PEP-CTERM sorting domain-containing protein [Nitrosomonas sp.]MCP5246674.1 PEP-CTERM sorting domain-containing protein [Burkholderiales bacterium]MDR4514849.1 PEP-CTERM sorting domain-containing protein [Nitrosomonas sp.]